MDIDGMCGVAVKTDFEGILLRQTFLRRSLVGLVDVISTSARMLLLLMRHLSMLRDKAL